MEEKQSRWSSWALYLALSALVVFVVKHTVGIDISGPVSEFMDVLLPVLTAFGVINNPTAKNHL